MPRRLLAALAAFAFAGTAAATVVTMNAPGAEVCRFRAAKGDPFQRWFSSQETTCVPAGTNTDFGPGLWNVFARSQTQVSADPVLVDGASAPATIALDAFDAATLSFQLAAGQTAVVYAPKRQIAYPASQKMLVPAGLELWIVTLSKSVPIGLTRLPPLVAGSSMIVAPPTIDDAHSDVLAWIELPEPDRTAVKKARGANLPHIRIGSGATEIEASILPPVENLDGAIVLIPHVSKGSASLQFGGRGWLPARRKIDAGPQPVTLVRDPIVARASASLVVDWSTLGDLPALDRSLGSCDRMQPTGFALTISACTASGKGEPVCTAVHTEPLQFPPTYGEVMIDEVPPGLYRAELRYGKLPPVSTTAQVAPLQQRPIYVRAEYLEAYGSLTRGGEPLNEDMRLEFPGGGVGFAPRGSDYHAVLTGLPGIDSKINVVTCKGERTLVLGEEMMRRNARWNIDIPANSLTISVVDTFTRRGLPAASIRYTVMSLRKPPVPVLTEMLVHDDKSGMPDRFFLRSVPPLRDINLQVKNSGYKTQDVAPFSLSKSEKKEIEVQVVPLDGTQGRVISSRPFEKAMLFWFSPQYGPTDRADVAPDGTFFYDERSHMRNEILVLVSASHPLWIARAPEIRHRQQLEIAFPDALPAREADVFVETNNTSVATVVGITVGGLHVPQAVFAQYLALRDTPLTVVNAGPWHLPPVAETGPIEVLRGPTVFTRVVTMPGRPAMFSAPEVVAQREFGTPVSSQLLAPGADRVTLPAK